MALDDAKAGATLYGPPSVDGERKPKTTGTHLKISNLAGVGWSAIQGLGPQI
jgi:hypothetical protein